MYEGTFVLIGAFIGAIPGLVTIWVSYHLETKKLEHQKEIEAAAQSEAAYKIARTERKDLYFEIVEEINALQQMEEQNIRHLYNYWLKKNCIIKIVASEQVFQKLERIAVDCYQIILAIPLAGSFSEIDTCEEMENFGYYLKALINVIKEELGYKD